MLRASEGRAVSPTLFLFSVALFLLLKVPSISSFLRPPSSSEHTKQTVMAWDPLSPESLVSAPCLIEQTLCEPSDDLPRFAAHKDYVISILDAWREEEEGSNWDVEWSSTTYLSKDEAGNDNTELHGHWIRPRGDSSSRAVILFHTAAGPHDIFLLWKAASLVSYCNVSVLIADVMSDETGWGWDSDRTRYQKVREQLRNNGVLASRVDAALEEVKRLGLQCIGAMGFCLGGLSILELAVSTRCPPFLATFHGVFSERPRLPDVSKVPRSELLICHGIDDPFVSSSDVEQVL